MRTLARLITSLAFLSLAACGGGGGGGGGGGTATPLVLGTALADSSCAGSVNLVIAGTGLDGSTVITLTPSGGGADITADSSTFVSSTEIQASFSGLAAGLYSVNAGHSSVSDTLVDALDLNAAPEIIHSYPVLGYNGINFQADVTLAQTGAAIVGAELVDASSAATTLVLDASVGTKHTVTVPSGLAAGNYQFRLTDSNGCSGLSPALTLNDTLGFTINTITPSAIAQGETPSLTLTTTASPAPFTTAPSVYLLPSGGAPTDIAIPLRDIRRTANTRIDMRMAPGLAVGDYAVIVVSADGSIGVSPAAITVTADSPLVFASASKTQVLTTAPDTVIYTGNSFDAGSTTHSAEYQCKSTGVVTLKIPATATILSSTQLEVTADFSSLQVGDRCSLYFTAAGGAVSIAEPIGVGSAANPVTSWTTANSLNTARRGAVALGYRVNSVEAYLYAIGGDNGTKAGAMSDIEVSKVDPWGGAGPWSVANVSLPSARTFAKGAVIGDFLYLVGGHNGTAAVNTIARAKVLQVDEVVDDVSYTVAPTGGGGLGAGQWFYRVAGIYNGADSDNPNGESLPGEFVDVTLPDYPGGLTVTLSWTAGNFPVAPAGYKVYRSVTPGDQSTMELVATVSGTSFIDNGSATQAGLIPLAPGALGKWHLVGTLNTPREGHAVAAAWVGGLGKHVLYSFGGRDNTGTYLDSYEYLDVQPLPSGSQTISASTTGGLTLGAARADLDAWIITPARSTQVSGSDVYVYLAAGRTSASTLTGLNEYAYLNASSTTPELLSGGATFTDTGTSMVAQSGYTSFFSTDVGGSYDYLVVDGGATAAGLMSGGLGSGLDAVAPAIFPANNSWNSLGGQSATVRRRFAAGVTLGVFNYLIGGGLFDNTPLADVERSTM